jgi:hypothetical protein
MGITRMDTTIRTATTGHIRTMAIIGLTMATAGIAIISAIIVTIIIGTKVT